MRTIDYSILNNDFTVGYNEVIEQVKRMPQECLSNLYRYIAFQIYCINQKEKQKEKQAEKRSPGLREFVGSINIDRDPLEIQKELRDEWN